MALKNEVPKTPAFSSRSLLLVFAVVCVVTGSNLWINRGAPPLGYAVFSNFGFSIAHPQDMYINTGAFIDAYPSSKSGQLQGSREGVGLEQFGVFWDTVDPTTDLEGLLDIIFEAAEAENEEGFIKFRGPLETITKGGHEHLYQGFEILDNDIVIPAVIGAWHCEENGKAYVLYLVKLPDLTHPERQPANLLGDWERYVNGFECH
jgi:hypothetical protein